MLNLLLAGGAVPSGNPLNFDWDYIVGNLPLAGIAAAIGLVMVFVILGVLIGCVTLFRVIVNKAEGSEKLKGFSARRAEKKAERQAARAESLARSNVYNVPSEAPAAGASEGVDGSVVAAVTAAVQAVLAEESGGPVEFVIKVIKRTR